MATPPTAPMNIAGKTGPPRKLLSDTLYASPLQANSSSSALHDHSRGVLHVLDVSRSTSAHINPERCWLVIRVRSALVYPARVRVVI
jgi:hypothetical protein